MSRKRSIPDSVRAGRSRIVPYYRGEDFRMRHARRLSANLDRRPTFAGGVGSGDYAKDNQ